MWASDNIDPMDRTRIVMGLSTLLPLELIGAHVASERSKTTGRRHDLALRLTVALFGHQGIEWDITDDHGRRAPRIWPSGWRWRSRSGRFSYGGELVRIERPSDPGTALFGVVAADKSEALFALVRERAPPAVRDAPRCASTDSNRRARYLLKRLGLAGDGAPVPADDRSRPEVERGHRARAPCL